MKKWCEMVSGLSSGLSFIREVLHQRFYNRRSFSQIKLLQVFIPKTVHTNGEGAVVKLNET